MNAPRATVVVVAARTPSRKTRRQRHAFLARDAVGNRSGNCARSTASARPVWLAVPAAWFTVWVLCYDSSRAGPTCIFPWRATASEPDSALWGSAHSRNVNPSKLHLRSATSVEASREACRARLPRGAAGCPGRFEAVWAARAVARGAREEERWRPGPPSPRHSNELRHLLSGRAAVAGCERWALAVAICQGHAAGHGSCE